MLAFVAPPVAAASATVSYNDKLKKALPDFEMPAAWQISRAAVKNQTGNTVLMGTYRSAACNRRHIRKSFRANP